MWKVYHAKVNALYFHDIGDRRLIIALQISSSDSITILMLTHFNKCGFQVCMSIISALLLLFITKSGRYC